MRGSYGCLVLGGELPTNRLGGAHNPGYFHEISGGKSSTQKTGVRTNPPTRFVGSSPPSIRIQRRGCRTMECGTISPHCPEKNQYPPSGDYLQKKHTTNYEYLQDFASLCLHFFWFSTSSIHFEVSILRSLVKL